MKKSYKSGTNVNIEIISTFLEMRSILKSKNLFEIAQKFKKIKIINILKVALISGHTVHETSLFGISSDAQGATSILAHPSQAAIPFGLRMVLFPCKASAR